MRKVNMYFGFTYIVIIDSSIDGEIAYSLSGETETALKRGPTSPKAILPEISIIAESVQWAMLK